MRGAPPPLRTRNTPWLFNASDWPFRLLTCVLASSRVSGGRSKNDLSFSPSESKSLRCSLATRPSARGVDPNHTRDVLRV
jgi:hypothetical protein